MKPEELIELLVTAVCSFADPSVYGRMHDIRHPEMAIVGEHVAAIGVEGANGDRPRIRLISLAHINEVHPVSEV